MDDFERLRGRLFGIAYRMLGSAADAEEILQDAWLHGVTELRFVMNPDKLAFAAAQLSRIGGLRDLSW